MQGRSEVSVRSRMALRWALLKHAHPSCTLQTIAYTTSLQPSVKLLETRGTLPLPLARVLSQSKLQTGNAIMINGAPNS